MPKTPSYRKRHDRNQAIVTLTDSVSKKRRNYWLGPHGTAESRERYHRVVAEWDANAWRRPMRRPCIALTVGPLPSIILLLHDNPVRSFRFSRPISMRLRLSPWQAIAVLTEPCQIGRLQEASTMRAQRPMMWIGRSGRMDRSSARRLSLPSVVLLFGLAITGCATTLAGSRHAPVRDDGLVGEWLFEPLGSARSRESVEAGTEEAKTRRWRFIVSDSPPLSSQRKPPQATVETAQREGQARERQSRAAIRYRVDMQPDRPQDNAAETTSIQGRLLESNGRRLFTFMRAYAPTEGPIYMLESPLQHTLRVERRGDELRIWAHEVWLGKTPLQFAGEYDFVPPTSMGEGGLVDDFDDIVEFYANSPEEKWQLLGVATRVKS